MEELLGPGVTQALARTADQLRADADALDDIAAERAVTLRSSANPVSGSRLRADATRDGAGMPAAGDHCPAGAGPPDDAGYLDAGQLAVLPAAIRTRLLRRAAIAAGAPAGALTAGHVADLDALVTDWHGQRWTDLPGGIRCQRRYDRLHFTAQA
jgi:tRNA(Ile)-lysidine synthase